MKRLLGVRSSFYVNYLRYYTVKMNAKRFMIWLPLVLFILLLKTTFDSSVCFQNASDMYSCWTDSTLLERAVACGGLTVLHDSLTWYSCINFPWHISSPLYPLLRSKKMFTKQEENHADQIPASSTTQIVPLLSSYYCALAILNSILVLIQKATRLTTNTAVNVLVPLTQIHFPCVMTCQVV